MGRLFRTVIDIVVAHFKAGVRQWDRFWFEPEDPTALGVLRILTGIMLVYTHLVWGLKLDAFLGANGFQDSVLVRALEPEGTVWSFWWIIPDVYRSTAHWFCIALLLLYMLGQWTSITKWAAPIITISYANRAPNANFGLDQINAMLALYLAIGPCGAKISLDRFWQTFRHGKSSLRTNEHWADVPAVVPRVSARLSTRLIQVHMCVIYFFAGVSKLKGEAWWNGDAVWMALANAEYQSANMTWVAWFPWISDIATHTTILWEMTFWVFIWKPVWRPIVLFAGILMHIGIGACLGMWTFGLVMIFTYVSYVPPVRLRQLKALAFDLLPAVQPIELQIERQTWKGLNWAALRKAVDMRQRVQLAFVDPPVVPQAAPSPVVTLGTVSPRIVTSAQWWSEHKHSITGWPFAICDRLDVHQPRMVVVHALLDTLMGLQAYFHGKGFDCRVARSASEACGLLFERPTDVLLMMGQSSREIEELLRLRDILRQAQLHAPASVTMVARLPEDYAVDRSPDHQLIVGSATHRELRVQVAKVLQERVCTNEEAEILASMTPAPARPHACEEHSHLASPSMTPPSVHQEEWSAPGPTEVAEVALEVEPLAIQGVLPS